MKIRNELFAGLAVILILSSLATYLIVRISLNKNFDDLVEKNDIAIAKKTMRNQFQPTAVKTVHSMVLSNILKG